MRIGEDTLLQRLNRTLTHVNIDETVEEIPPYCFYRCHRLKDVVIPGSVKIIDHHSFQHCANIGSITLNEGLEKIGTYAFYYSCYDENNGSGGFEYVKIPSTVTTIDQYAFGYCKCLKEINVPPLVAKLDRTFAYCKKLERLIMEPINPPTFINTFLGNSFNAYTKTGEIWIENSEAVDNYLEATNWSNWSSIMNTYAWLSKVTDRVLSPGETSNFTVSVMGLNPQLSIICDNDNINASITNDGSATLEAVKEGTTQVTIKVNAGNEGEYEFTRNCTVVVSGTEVQEVTIESVEGKYAFTTDEGYEDEDGEIGYYISTNAGIDSSQSVAKVVLNLPIDKTVYVDCILDSRLQTIYDGYYDGPLIGYLDSECPDIMEVEEEYYEAINTKKAFDMEYDMDYTDDELPMKRVYKYGTVNAGLHYFYIVYYKDEYKGKSGSDAFRFKIRLEG